ncbi:putative disease resistance protein RGA1 [Sorghum bicolor]|uniref:putative disease resistance protein RGA1 n=1 Tax=Sorghum bicolor TaxID=4558 RepID=UPI0001A857BC|nr:putative disease resistance protein RGA1 [Sorghum bicolor]|eukprot:XP_002451730.1 putative disease resistance protein RGA1 [Sorghum bicolor]
MESVSSDLAEFIMLLQCCPPALHRPLATNIYADCQVFGRHLERRRVIDFLLHDEDAAGGGELGVLPIFGRAGLGKTTRVQHVCDEPAVRRHFSLIMQVDFHCMSLTVPSEAVQLLRSLFSVASTASVAGEQLRLLERKLRGETFLAVFDNVDPRKKRVMDAIMPALRRGRTGSRIIVTGSDRHVVDLGTTKPIILRPLPPEEYWFFFKTHAFGSADDAEADPRLAAAGQAIAKRLRGSFFGAKAVGALLRSRPDHKLWRRVLAASHAESSWFDHGGYVAATAGSLLPPHVTVRGVAVSGSPVRGLLGLQDATLTAPADPDGGGGRLELPVLLCKSVFPSYCLYYTAYCTIDTESKQ